MVCPIFAAMPREQQMKVFEPAPAGVRKVILATNIAETSITINGVRYVVDTGLVKQRSFVASSGMEMLQTESVSKAQAWQRTGRAGREAPGICYRLFPEDTFEQLPERAIPDIQRVSLEVVVLQLKCMGIDDVLGFDFIEKPLKTSLIKALEKLYALGALDNKGKLTTRGRQMAGLPVEPMYAVMLLKATELGCAEEALSVVAMLAVARAVRRLRRRPDHVAERLQRLHAVWSEAAQQVVSRPLHQPPRHDARGERAAAAEGVPREAGAAHRLELPRHRPAAEEHRGWFLSEHGDAIGGRGSGRVQDGLQNHVRPVGDRQGAPVVVAVHAQSAAEVGGLQRVGVHEQALHPIRGCDREGVAGGAGALILR
ncbi:hypothetical protein ON010_g17766 [Phytophthora cinnamomi]|nr:hypothetical protein ON010_g17766 [Phytophthora cinnamomi]